MWSSRQFFYFSDLCPGGGLGLGGFRSLRSRFGGLRGGLFGGWSGNFSRGSFDGRGRWSRLFLWILAGQGLLLLLFFLCLEGHFHLLGNQGQLGPDINPKNFFQGFQGFQAHRPLDFGLDCFLVGISPIIISELAPPGCY